MEPLASVDDDQPGLTNIGGRQLRLTYCSILKSLDEVALLRRTESAAAHSVSA